MYPRPLSRALLHPHARLESARPRRASKTGRIAGEDGALAEFEALQERAGELDAYQVEGKVEKVAAQMGFGEADLDALVASFSGGWKMRIGLGPCGDASLDARRG